MNVVVKLDYDALATYAGGVPGLAPTSPAATGRRLDLASPAAQAYRGYAVSIEDRFLSALTATVPDARVGARLRIAYGGVALTVAQNRVGDLLRLPGVLAVQRDRLEHPLAASNARGQLATRSSGQLATTTAQPGNGGRGVIVADIDTGVWPEHPMLADDGQLATPPPTADGHARPCAFGNDVTKPERPHFACNDKLIGGRAFMDAYDALIGGERFQGTARDAIGHGTHTATTAAGDRVASAPLFGIDRGPVSGVAPNAYVLAYKVCGAAGCIQSDSVAAIGQAIADGADVINYSISGGEDPYTDPVELAFLDAYAAGVLFSASVGNEGPHQGTANHLSPWVTAVGAVSPDTGYRSTVTLQGGGETLVLNGASIGAGVDHPVPVVIAGDDPHYGLYTCAAPLPRRLAEGRIVACLRGGVSRAFAGWAVSRGGAAGMLLFNQFSGDVETDNHFVPTVHLDAPVGLQLVDFVRRHPDATATFTPGTQGHERPDVLALFSSLGPAGDWVKPDLVAPGHRDPGR